MSAKRSKVVKGEKGMRLTVYPWTHPATGSGRWRFAWRDGNGWRHSTFKTKAEAEGVEWFAVRSSTVPTCSDGIEVNIAESENLSLRKALKTKQTA